MKKRLLSLILVVAVISVICSVVAATILLTSNTVSFHQTVNNTQEAIELQTPSNPADIYNGTTQTVTVQGYIPSTLSSCATITLDIRKAGYATISTSDISNASFTYDSVVYYFGPFTELYSDNTTIVATATINVLIPATNANVHPITNMFNGTLAVTYATPYDYYVDSVSMVGEIS